MNKDNTHENIKRVEYDYKFSDKVMLKHKAAYKYKTTYD